MSIPTEINALKYYELETKARGFDILQELEVLNDRVSILKNAKIKVIKDLQNIYKKMEEPSESSSESNNNNRIEDQKSEQVSKKIEDDKNRSVKSVHSIGK